MKKLYKSDDNVMVSGVLGGVAEYYEMDPVIVRIIAFLIAIVTGIVPFALVYLLSAVVIPKRQRGHSETVFEADKPKNEENGEKGDNA